MQFSPALPWAAGTRGTITLQEPVSKADLLNGALTFINSSGYLFQPEDSDGYVDYIDENDSPVISIAFNDDETKNVLNVGIAQDANVKDIILGPTCGSILDVMMMTEDLDYPELGDTGYMVADCLKDGQYVKCALTQDGINVISGINVLVDNDWHRCKIFSSGIPVPALANIKLSSATPVGQIASLPKLKVQLASFDNSFSVKVLHAPADVVDEGAYMTPLIKTGNAPCYWGDNITELFM